MELEEAKKILEKYKQMWRDEESQAIEIVLQELEKLQKSNQLYINSIQSTASVLSNEYVSKDKIREKIEELKRYIYTGKNAPQDFLQYRIQAKINALEELLEE